MCFLCLWNSREDNKHYIKKDWPPRPINSIGRFNSLHKPLVDCEKVYLPPLYLKPCLMKNFVKAFNKNGHAFQYLVNKFHRTITEAKLKAGVFNGPQIGQLVNDDEFLNHLTIVEKSAWRCFVDVVRNFLGKNRAPN